MLFDVQDMLRSSRTVELMPDITAEFPLESLFVHIGRHCHSVDTKGRGVVAQSDTLRPD